MDANMKDTEIVFAQRLASGDSAIRRRAFKLLEEYFRKQSENKTFSEETLQRFCKGLHYTLWMQDKPLLQEELSEKIAQLINLCKTEEQSIALIRALIFSLSTEWPTIDRWRMDKFLLFLRILLRTIFLRLRQQKWANVLVKKYIDFLKNTMISGDSKICESLKYHFAAIYLDELDNAGGLNDDIVMKFIEPYGELLGEKISDLFFRTICTEIFDTILHEFSENLNERGAKILEANQKISVDENENEEKIVDVDENEENEEKSTNFQFQYSQIADMLFKIGSLKKVVAKRRQRIYNLSKKFENCTKNIDPYPPINFLPTISRKRKRKN